MEKSRGFSMIELMVVIAVAAILAAVAVPAYQSYIKSSKVTVAVSAAKALSDNITQYYDTKGGVFPTEMSQVGYNSSTTNFPQNFPPATAADYPAPPYWMGMQFYGYAGSPGVCPYFAVFSYASNLDSSGAYTPSNVASYVVVEHYVYNVNGVWTDVCQYLDISFSPVFAYSSDNTIPECYNIGTTDGNNASSNAINAIANSC